MPSDWVSYTWMLLSIRSSRGAFHQAQIRVTLLLKVPYGSLVTRKVSQDIGGKYPLPYFGGQRIDVTKLMLVRPMLLAVLVFSNR